MSPLTVRYVPAALRVLSGTDVVALVLVVVVAVSDGATGLGAPPHATKQTSPIESREMQGKGFMGGWRAGFVPGRTC